MKKIIFVLSVVASFHSQAERFNADNNPASFNRIHVTKSVMNYDLLPKNGRLTDDRMSWSETYWPANIGGISYRWNHPDPQPFTYELLPYETLKTMTRDELAQLSPSELYDISQGDYDYTLTRSVRKLNSKNDAWWEGICHGWTQAASNFPEPSKVIIKNKDGILVPFGASDVKGLISMHDSNLAVKGTYAAVGKKCNVKGKVEGEEDSRDGQLPKPTPEQMNLPECRDTNAGAFHVVISNMIGIHGISFVAEIDRFADLWNQPVYAYETTFDGDEPVTAEQSLDGIARRIRVTNIMTYGEELQIWTQEKETAHPEWIHWLNKNPVTGTAIQQFRKKTYKYILELDLNGNIVGGEWISSTRPDFIWAKVRRTFEDSVQAGYSLPLAGLKQIYHPIR